jgi:3-phenylpropionate/trans-cinnamate dioxygenase ferredoxin subunit
MEEARMDQWESVGPDTMLADGAMTEVRVGNEMLLLARVAGQYYAAQARCPHMGGYLARGKLDGFVVTCPRHGSQFDVRDGHNVAWITAIQGIARKVAEGIKKAQNLRTHATQIRDGQVWVDLS